jgi:uncharacterized protein
MNRLTGPIVAALFALAAPAAEPTVDADPALWVLRDTDTTLYLFGTVHLLRPGLGWFDEGVAKAFAESGELLLEVVPPGDPAALVPLMMQKAVDPNGRMLTSKLSASQREIYATGMSKMGLPAEKLEQFEAWFVSLQLSQVVAAGAGLDPLKGAEAELMAAARAAGKPITGFETVAEQLAFLDGTPESEQIAGLIEIVANPEEVASTIEQLIASWMAGDPEKTAELMNKEIAGAPETARILLTDRNRRWAKILAERMGKPGTVFVAVGAGHLVGADSVQERLTRAGFTVQRVKY